MFQRSVRGSEVEVPLDCSSWVVGLFRLPSSGSWDWLCLPRKAPNVSSGTNGPTIKSKPQAAVPGSLKLKWWRGHRTTRGLHFQPLWRVRLVSGNASVPGLVRRNAIWRLDTYLKTHARRVPCHRVLQRAEDSPWIAPPQPYPGGGGIGALRLGCRFLFFIVFLLLSL